MQVLAQVRQQPPLEQLQPVARLLCRHALQLLRQPGQFADQLADQVGVGGGTPGGGDGLRQLQQPGKQQQERQRDDRFQHTED